MPGGLKAERQVAPKRIRLEQWVSLVVHPLDYKDDLGHPGDQLKLALRIGVGPDYYV